MDTESSCETKLKTSAVPSGTFIIFAPWEYKSEFGMGADYGRHICIYSPSRRTAIYIQTRDLVAHYQLDSITGMPRQQNEINAKRDIFSRKLVDAKTTLEEQLKYLCELNVDFSACQTVATQLPIEALDILLDPNSNPQVVYSLLPEGLQGPSAEAETL